MRSSSNRTQRRNRRRAAVLALAAATGLTTLAAAPARAETVTRWGHVSITPGWTTAVFDRSLLVLPFTATAPCETTDYGDGNTYTSCDSLNVDLVHSSSPSSEDSTLVFPKDDGTGAGSLSVYGWQLQSFGTHTLRATDLKTGETATATILIKALTRTTAVFSRSKKAPTAATLRVSALTAAFTGSGYTPATLRHPLVLQRQAAGRWVGLRTVWTTNGAASWSLKVTRRMAYRVCFAGNVQATASCSSARAL